MTPLNIVNCYLTSLIIGSNIIQWLRPGNAIGNKIFDDVVPAIKNDAKNKITSFCKREREKIVVANDIIL